MDIATKNKLRFLAGVKKDYPALYYAATGSNKGGLSGLGITVEEMLAEQDAFAEPIFTGTQTSTASGAPWYRDVLNSVLDSVKQLAPAYIGVKQAQTCVQINAERARNNQAPIDCAAGGLAPQVAVGISPDVKWILWGALGIGAMFLLMRRR